MKWQMACTGSSWCDFVSFDPRLPDRHQLFVIRLDRDDKYIKELEEEVTKFLDEVESTINKLESLNA